MFDSPKSVALLKRVALRLHLAALAGRLYGTFLVCCVAYGVLLVSGRLTGFATEWLTPASLVIVPGLAAIIALLWHHRPNVVEAARVVDRHSGTKDLFLTVALIDNTAGEFQPLVARTADERAARVSPHVVVPFRWGREAAQAALAGALIVVGLH